MRRKLSYLLCLSLLLGGLAACRRVDPPAVTEEDTTPAKKGCRSTVTATLPLLAAGCAMALAKKKRSQ